MSAEPATALKDLLPARYDKLKSVFDELTVGDVVNIDPEDIYMAAEGEPTTIKLLLRSWLTNELPKLKPSAGAAGRLDGGSINLRGGAVVPQALGGIQPGSITSDKLTDYVKDLAGSLPEPVKVQRLDLSGNPLLDHNLNDLVAAVDGLLQTDKVEHLVIDISNMRIHNLKEPVCKWASNANVAYIVVCGTLFATIDHKDALAGLSIDVLKKLILVPATWVARPAWLALFKNDAEKIKVSLETHALYYNQIPQFTPRR